MSRINVISGDFLAGDAEFQSGLFTLKTVLKPSLELTIPISKIKELETATEEVVKNQGSIIRWSLAGALLLGPIGLIAGWLLCDTEREITFYAKFKDGRCLLATTDIDTYSADSTTLGHSAHDHLDTRSMLTWTPDPRPLGQAVGAQRRRFALLV